MTATPRRSMEVTFTIFTIFMNPWSQPASQPLHRRLSPLLSTYSRRTHLTFLRLLHISPCPHMSCMIDHPKYHNCPFTSERASRQCNACWSFQAGLVTAHTGLFFSFPLQNVFASSRTALTRTSAGVFYEIFHDRHSESSKAAT